MNRILQELRAMNLRLGAMERQLKKLVGFHRGEQRLVEASGDLGVETEALRKAIKKARRPTKRKKQDA